MLIRLVHERAQNHIVKIASPVDRIFSAVDGVCVFLSECSEKQAKFIALL